MRYLSRVSPAVRSALIAVAGLLAHSSASADASLAVQVVDARTGTALEGIGVCLGTAAEPGQLGTLRTDADGRALFKAVPPGPLQLVVSGSGYVGQKRPIEPLYKSGALVMKLAPGWRSGPRCVVADETGSGNGPGLAITDLDVTPPAAPGHAVRIGVRTRGEADQIRISERQDFRDADWQPYRPEVSYTLSPGRGGKQVFVQVRRAAGHGGASIQALSPVRSVSVNLP